MKRKLGFLVAGMYFGFVLSRVGASDYDLIYGLFIGRDFRLAGVILTAIFIATLGLVILESLVGHTKDNEPISIQYKPLGKYSLLGGVLFGIGWSIAGACPGTVLAQVGEGKILAVFTFAGLIVGTWLYAWLWERWSNNLA